MFKPHVMTGLLSLALVAGCGDQTTGGGEGSPSSDQQPSITVKSPDNPWHKKLLARNEVDRKLALRRAVQDDGGSCRSIRSSAYQREYKGMAMWVAYCTNGDWAVYVAPSGVIQARACKDAAQLGLPQCAPSAETKALQPAWTNEASPMPAPVNQID